MDRLLSSSSQTPLKLSLKPSTLLIRTSRFDSSTPIFSSSKRYDCRRVNSISRKHESPHSSSTNTPSFASSQLRNNLRSPSSSPVGSSDSSAPKSTVLNQISNGAFQKRKAITARTSVTLSALVMILLQPAFAPSAMATFQATSKAGGPAAAAVARKLIQTELLSSAWTGFFTGCLHTLSGPDHLAALAPLSIVHGLQPDALMMVLPALALPSRLAGAAFLIMFLLGTVVAMGSYTVFLGSCSQALTDKLPKITEKLTWVSSIVAIALGFAILISQFFGFSLY